MYTAHAIARVHWITVACALAWSLPASAGVSYKVKPECVPIEAALKTMYKEDKAKYRAERKAEYAAAVKDREFAKDVYASLKRIYDRLNTKAFRDMMAACEAGVAGAQDRVWKMMWDARDAEKPFEKAIFKDSPYSFAGTQIRSDYFKVSLNDSGNQCFGNFHVDKAYYPKRDNSECLKDLNVGLTRKTRECQASPDRPACFTELKEQLGASQEICTNYSYDWHNSTEVEARMAAWPLKAPRLDDIVDAPVKPDLEYFSESFYVVKNIDAQCLVLDGELPAASASHVATKFPELAPIVNETKPDMTASKAYN